MTSLSFLDDYPWRDLLTNQEHEIFGVATFGTPSFRRFDAC